MTASVPRISEPFFYWHSVYIGPRMSFDACLAFIFRGSLPPLLASECGARQLITLISSPAAQAVGLWGNATFPSPSKLSNNTFSLGEQSLRAQFSLWMVTPSLRLMSERRANSQGFALACSGGCVKGLGETNSDMHVMVIQLDSLAQTAERPLA